MVQQTAYQSHAIQRNHAAGSVYESNSSEYSHYQPRTPPNRTSASTRTSVDTRRLLQQRRDMNNGSNRITTFRQTSRERLNGNSGVQLMRSASIRGSSGAISATNASSGTDNNLRVMLLGENGSYRTRTVRRTRPTPVSDNASADNVTNSTAADVGPSVRPTTFSSMASTMVINGNAQSSEVDLQRTPHARTLAQVARVGLTPQMDREGSQADTDPIASVGADTSEDPNLLRDAMDTSEDDMISGSSLLGTEEYLASRSALERSQMEAHTAAEALINTAALSASSYSSARRARTGSDDSAVGMATETDTSPQSRARSSGEGVVHTSRVMSLEQFEAERLAQISALAEQQRERTRGIPNQRHIQTHTQAQTQSPLQSDEILASTGGNSMRLRDGNINFQSHQFRSRMARAMRTSQIAQQQFEAKAVCTITCRFCDNQLSDRGMRAILLGDTNVELYSTDLPPTDTLGLVGEDYTTKNCACQIKDSACLTCGNVMGYHVTQPCTACLEACHNGHFWMLHSDVTKAQELFTTDGLLMRWGSLTNQSEEDLACFQQYGDLPKCLATVKCIR